MSNERSGNDGCAMLIVGFGTLLAICLATDRVCHKFDELKQEVQSLKSQTSPTPKEPK